MNQNCQKIYEILMPLVRNPIGVCALLGNIKAESSFRANDVERAKSEKYGWTDESYTEAVDNGTYTKEQFIKDKFGYGLVSWTWWQRKEKLYNFAKECEKSIGDLEMQVTFILKEIKKYNTPYYELFHGTDLAKATRTIMLKYEAPANQTEANIQKRIKYAQDIYEELIGKYELITLRLPRKTYLTAADALSKTNSIGLYLPGKYWVYKKSSNGTMNVSRTKGSPGGWINL